jgi:cleavage and polyadenylation specificity factor subunit 1
MKNHVLLIQLFMEKYKNTKENETILAIGTAYVQGEDVGRGRVLLFFVGKNIDNPQNLFF